MIFSHFSIFSSASVTPKLPRHLLSCPHRPGPNQIPENSSVRGWTNKLLRKANHNGQELLNTWRSCIWGSITVCYMDWTLKILRSSWKSPKKCSLKATEERTRRYWVAPHLEAVFQGKPDGRVNFSSSRLYGNFVGGRRKHIADQLWGPRSSRRPGRLPTAGDARRHCLCNRWLHSSCQWDNLPLKLSRWSRKHVESKKHFAHDLLNPGMWFSHHHQNFSWKALCSRSEPLVTSDYLSLHFARLLDISHGIMG